MAAHYDDIDRSVAGVKKACTLGISSLSVRNVPIWPAVFHFHSYSHFHLHLHFATQSHRPVQALHRNDANLLLSPKSRQNSLDHSSVAVLVSHTFRQLSHTHLRFYHVYTNFHPIELIKFAEVFTSNRIMTTKFVTTGRRRSRGRGSGAARGSTRGGGRGSSMSKSTTPAPATVTSATEPRAAAPVPRAAARQSASATPAPTAGAPPPTTRTSQGPVGGLPRLKLKLNVLGVRADSGYHRAFSNAPVLDEETHGKPDEEADPDIDALFEDDGVGVEEGTVEPDSEDDLPTADVDTDTRRSGRAVKKVRHEDYDYGSEDAQAAEEDHKQEQQNSSQQPSVQILQVAESTATKRGRLPRTLPNVTRDAQVTPRVKISKPLPSLVQNTNELQPDPRVLEILNHLKSSTEVLTELPELYDHQESGKVLPYTATQLMHIYLIAHHLKLWNICDLVSDTWIRAFHSQRSRDARVTLNDRLWRKNRVLEKRHFRYEQAKKAGRVPDEPKEFEKNAPEYNISVEDPSLHQDVLSFDSTLLSELYAHTPSTCGARRLWADAMVLAGDKASRMFEQSDKRGFKWDEELKGDVMKTSLRMLRRKVTLKIEESSEGAWCQRYHMHGEADCYRKVAARWVANGGNAGQVAREGAGNAGWSSDEDSDGMGEMIRRGLEEEGARGAKRRRLE
ncbi:hypothetical protein T440DRAFT_508892 [Plenodomus tracheiphilus IPT5]|uniref:Uncharacterized protein n=1 Tax=Plenodomus tracheiphilus IPT5 TaxID=1408161 RepID=A0A6A7B1T6_9PLEO|nr:hypothetical protein T440DRAFT_508892 [Plenodomus tracheiphilus IPT5]